MTRPRHWYSTRPGTRPPPEEGWWSFPAERRGVGEKRGCPLPSPVLFACHGHGSLFRLDLIRPSVKGLVPFPDPLGELILVGDTAALLRDPPDHPAILHLQPGHVAAVYAPLQRIRRVVSWHDDLDLATVKLERIPDGHATLANHSDLGGLEGIQLRQRQVPQRRPGTQEGRNVGSSLLQDEARSVEGPPIPSEVALEGRPACLRSLGFQAEPELIPVHAEDDGFLRILQRSAAARRDEHLVTREEGRIQTEEGARDDAA
eukprot:scaffold980_cov248-Pinguiococcus_pyrenoidosus.AAC.2